ncbi:MAG: LuxR C-terminal-related transcriptional regulator [Actinomycetota bacterium]|nr:LuxR C-terminal-related transcriptional regulator [Actinomycetota bacterium]
MPARWEPLLGPTLEERALLRLLAAGKTPDQSASALHLSPARVESTLHALQSRLHLSRRRALLVHAALRGWL